MEINSMENKEILENSSIIKDISLLRDKLNKACSEFYEENYPKLKSNRANITCEFVGAESEEYYDKTIKTLLDDIKNGKRTSDLAFDLVFRDRITFKKVNANDKNVASELYDFHHLMKNKLIKKLDLTPFGNIKLIKVDPEEKQIDKVFDTNKAMDETIYVSLMVFVDLTNFYVEKNKIGDK